MGQITTGVGLISGLNIADIVDQLMAIEARPKQLVQKQSTVLQSQAAAYQSVAAQMLALKTSASGLTSASAFGAKTATSSNESVLTVSSAATAVEGSYSFMVHRLVAAQQTITGGFQDTDQTPLTGGTLTFERGEAKLSTQTLLTHLNGGAGIRRGSVRITDRSGASAVVDLSRVATVQDVLDAINSNTNIRVEASVSGDGLKITDLTGATTSNLIVADVGTTATASSLGLVGSAAAAELTGTQINEVGRATVLAWLNDGNGVRSRDSLNDFRIASAGGGTYDVNISDAVTLGNVIDAINTATGGQVTAAISDDGLGLKLTDAGGGGAGFTVTALNSSNAATDLGILGSDGDSDGVISGDRLIAGINSKLIRNLNGGSGVTTLGTIAITDRAGGGPTAVDLSSAQSIADVIDLINAAGANVTASLNSAGNGLLLTDSSGGSGDIVISDTSGTAATDLGLSGTFSDSDTVDSGNLQFKYITESTRLDALGVSRGKFLITDSAGVSATVDLTQGDEVNIGKVLQEINSRGLQINARINDNGDGIVLEDTGPGVVAIKVEESGSTTAKNLGLLGEAANAGDDLDGSFEKTISFSSPNLAGASTLASLNGGEGVNIKAGSDDLTITTRSGASYSVNLDGATTIDAVITAISTATGGDVTASVNSLSTGLKLTDNTAGASTFTIEAANDSSAGADLGIIGTDSDANGIISGSTIVEVTTLQTLATKINDAKIGISASIISDGSIGTPYRLSLASTTAGSSGAFIFDDGGLGFGATNLSEAQDAVVFFGGNDPTQSLVVTSTSNTLKNVIPGATIDLLATTSTPVQVTIARNDAAIVTSVKGFVDKFNSVMSTINNLDSYDSETKKRGLLLGDSALSQIRSQLFRIVISRNTELSSQYQALAQIGITVGSGAVLQFDETKFGNALAANQDAVKALFTFKETETDEDGVVSIASGGIGVRIEELLKRLTDSETGPLQTRVDAIEGQIKLNAKRIESLDKLLEAKRARLERQFIAMEKALAGLQDQGSALNGLQNIAANLKNSK